MKIADTLLIFSIVIASNGIPSLNAGGGTGAQSVSGEAVKTPQNGITSVHMKDLPNEREVLVYFTGRTQGEVSDIAAGQIAIRFLPSKKVVPGTSITDPNAQNTPTSPPATRFSAPFGNSALQIGLFRDDSTQPEKDDTQVEVSFKSIHFLEGPPKALSATGPIYNKSNIQDLVALTRKALAAAKTTDEKDEFLSLGVTIPGATASGSGNTAASAVGSLDINFNRDFYSADVTKEAGHLFDSASVGFVLKKGNSDTSNPRHFQAGLKFRKTILLANRANLTTIRNSIASGASSPDAITLAAISNLQQAFLRGVIIDNAGYYEGDAKGLRISNVSNAVYNLHAQVASVARALSSQTGFWSFRCMPAGFELGHNLTATQTVNAERGSLARYKLGGQLNLHYQARDSARRVEFEALTIHRALFMDENGVDVKTNRVITIHSGSKNWTEASLRFYFGETILNHRIGIKVDYQRGYLPPVYAQTKTFKYGLIFESKDDDTSGQ